jgi:hypothetical protein
LRDFAARINQLESENEILKQELLSKFSNLTQFVGQSRAGGAGSYELVEENKRLRKKINML